MMVGIKAALSVFVLPFFLHHLTLRSALKMLNIKIMALVLLVATTNLAFAVPYKPIHGTPCHFDGECLRRQFGPCAFCNKELGYCQQR
jgi:hypothetical protein